jgi:hypothetical protein
MFADEKEVQYVQGTTSTRVDGLGDKGDADDVYR